MRARWVAVWVAAVLLLALAATWLGMSVATSLALEPVRVLSDLTGA